MTANFVINPGDTVQVVVAAASPWVQVEVQPPATEAVVTVAGPQGPPGPSGPSYTGVAWFYGEGPPGTILGSKPFDYYLDTISGTLYRLGA